MNSPDPWRKCLLGMVWGFSMKAQACSVLREVFPRGALGKLQNVSFDQIL